MIKIKCKCGHYVSDHEELRLSQQPCYQENCDCKDYIYEGL